MASAVRRWNKFLHEIYTVLVSVREAGGVVSLTSGWSEEQRRGLADEIRGIRDKLDGMLSTLEREGYTDGEHHQPREATGANDHDGSGDHRRAC